ncbi:hypothetical protein D3C72_1782260 [compost metagenome]
MAKATAGASASGATIVRTSPAAISAMLLPASSGAVRAAMNSRCHGPSPLPNAGEVPDSTMPSISAGVAA